MLIYSGNKFYFVADKHTFTKKEMAKAILFDGANPKDFEKEIDFNGIEFFRSQKWQRA